MRLGEYIAYLKDFVEPDLELPIGLEYPDSYRGDYACLMFRPGRRTTIRKMLFHAEFALGKEFTGYKGGTYLMTERTECYIDYWGEANDVPLTKEIVDFLVKVLPYE
jgi:hypothetical protein